MATYVFLTLKVKPGKMAEFRRLHKLIREQEQLVWDKYGAKLLGEWEVLGGKEFEISKTIPGFHKLGEVHESEVAGHEIAELFAYDDIANRHLAYEENSKNETLQKILKEVTEVVVPGSRHVKILNPIPDSLLK
ncbi:hypothetical protein ACFLUS_00980 [Chloroflexota bacterium]